MPLPKSVFSETRPCCLELPSSLTNNLPFFLFLLRNSTSSGQMILGNGGSETQPTGSFTILVLVSGMPITGEIETTDSARGGFGSAGAGTPESFFSGQ